MPYYPLQIDTKTSPVGEDIIGYSKAYDIGGVSVDNPTNSWLSIDTIPGGVFVPPLTLGWAQPLSIPKSSISVKFVEAPFGQLSVLSGQPISVTIYEARPDGGSSIAASQGISIAQIGTGGFTRTILTIVATETSASGNFGIASPNNRIIPLTVQLFAAGGGTQQLRGDVLANWVLIPPGSPGGVFATMVISPETPQAPEPEINWVQEITTINQDIAISAQSAPGVGAQSITAAIVWRYSDI